MKKLYAQKSSAVPKTAALNATSVLDSSVQSEFLQRKADMANNATQRAEAPRPNNTGMPDNLKAGIESLSGFSMDDVRVHYNSSKPATVQALAYTQGTDIHVAPGQEKHLPHEAWHVAQQMAGRVSPTTNINGMPVNDNAALEHEADVMGAKAVQCVRDDACRELVNKNISQGAVQCEFVSRIKAFPEENIDRGVAGTGRGVTGAGRGVAGTGRGVAGAGRGVTGAGRGVTRDDHGVTGTGRAETRDDRGMTTDGSDMSVDLPVIAFEVLVGVGDRIGEIATLYNNVIGKYNGPAHIYVGVNQMSYTRITPQPNVTDAKKLQKLKSPPNDLRKAVAEIKKIQINPNHQMHIIPFVWIPTYNPEETQKGGYTFPYMEARHLLMTMAHECGASVFRWIDSDVDDDTSIDVVNEKGVGAFDSVDGEAPIVYSGFYNWRGGGAGDNVDKINTHEAFLRKFFWYSRGCFEGYLAEEHKYDGKHGYIPEPIAYMNKAAHKKAFENLSEKFKSLGYAGSDSCQQNEAESAFKDMSMIFKPDFSVSKPVKEGYSVTAPHESLDELLNVRQSAFRHWTWDDTEKDDSRKKCAFDSSKSSQDYENEQLIEKFDGILNSEEK